MPTCTYCTYSVTIATISNQQDDQNEIYVPQLAWKILDTPATEKLMSMNVNEQTK